MVTIGLVSDTHGWLHPALKEHFGKVDHIIHAGDIGKDEVIDQLEAIAPTTVVRGNIDGGNLQFLPLTAVLELGGKRIAVLHIAGNPFHPKRKALQLIREAKADIFVAGHSHIPVVGKVEGALWINPGAAGNEGHHYERFAKLLTIEDDGEVKLHRIRLGARGQN